MTGEKSFIHRAFRNNDGSGTDFDIKAECQKILRPYGVYLSIPSQNEKYFGVRPDGIDLKNKFVLESNGTAHGKPRVQLQDEYKVETYKKNNLSICAISPEILQHLEETEASPLECWLVGVLYTLKYSNGLNCKF